MKLYFESSGIHTHTQTPETTESCKPDYIYRSKALCLRKVQHENILFFKSGPKNLPRLFKPVGAQNEIPLSFSDFDN